MSVSKPMSVRAAQARINSEFIPSPCNSVCVMDPVDGLCQGCRRTLDEISNWSLMSAVDKRAVWERIEKRIAVKPL
jgi:predicted Fe-S protein YdhL (DUF1289 family)